MSALRMVARAASDVSRAMPEIDDLASNESNRLAFEAFARAAARYLMAAADIRDRQWLRAEAKRGGAEGRSAERLDEPARP